MGNCNARHALRGDSIGQAFATVRVFAGGVGAARGCVLLGGRGHLGLSAMFDIEMALSPGACARILGLFGGLCSFDLFHR